MRVFLGTGVMAKDGVTPWAPSTFHVVTLARRTPESEPERWMSPISFSWPNLAKALADPGITELRIIDEKNNEIVLCKDEADVFRWVRVDPEVTERARETRRLRKEKA